MLKIEYIRLRCLPPILHIQLFVSLKIITSILRQKMLVDFSVVNAVFYSRQFIFRRSAVKLCYPPHNLPNREESMRSSTKASSKVSNTLK